MLVCMLKMTHAHISFSKNLLRLRGFWQTELESCSDVGGVIGGKRRAQRRV